MIVRHERDLPKFDKDETLTVDVETTSFDDKKEGYNPFQGSRIAGIAVSTMDQRNSWYVPIRCSVNPTENIPLPNARAWMKDLLESGRDIVNHFIKFDARCWYFDGCKVKGRLICTAIMARLWQSDLRNLSLNHLTGGGKDKAVKKYLKSIRSKDWGRVPIDIIGPYAQTDTKLATGLYQKFKKEMRSECRDVWNTEIALTKHLLNTEIHGIRIDVHGLKVTYRNLLRRMLILQEEIDKMAGCEVDCLSSDNLNEVLHGRMNFEIQSWTGKEKPQWNKAALLQIGHPIGKKISEFTHLSYFTTVFCQGWLNKMGDDERLHPNHNQSAAVTGRMTSKDPCTTNLPGEAEIFILPDEGCAILGVDYSQIEYRIFAHYANDEEIIRNYKENENADYHQMLADMLGVPRTFSKSLNFSFLFGMGKKALLQTIAGIIALSKNEESMVEKLRAFGLVAGRAFAKTVKDMDFTDYEVIANGIYTEYHKRVPSMKQLGNRVYNVILARGWLKNYMGRIYNVPSKAAYKGVNILIQGSAADIFKNRILAVLDQMAGLWMIANVYDSIYFNVPLSELRSAYKQMMPILEDFNLRVPLKVQPTVGLKNLGTCVKAPKLKDVDKALKKSLTYEREFKRKTIRAADFMAPGKQRLEA